MSAKSCALLAAVLLFGGTSAASALDADYWRGGWRTPLGTDPHIYQFVIRGDTVSGIYCENCADLTTIGVIDGSWDEEEGIEYTVTFPNPDGSIASVEQQHALLVGSELIITGDVERTLIKDPRGPGIFFNTQYMFPPGTPPTPTLERDPARADAPPPPPPPAYWQPGPYEQITPEAIDGSWIAIFDTTLGMNKQIFSFFRVEDELHGVVCGRCDNPWTYAALENIVIVDDTIYFDIVHQDWGEIDPPLFDRQIVGHLVENELIWSIASEDIDPHNPPEIAPELTTIFRFVGPISREDTAGNSTEGIDVWGPGTGSSAEPPEGAYTISPAFPE